MNFEKKINNESIIELLDKNLIGRNKYLDKMLNILLNSEDCHFISLDGNWGAGKSFFVSQMNLLINYCRSFVDGKKIEENVFYNQKINLNKEQIDKLEKILKSDELKEFSNKVKENCINSLYFNAWEHDDENDPLLSIMYQIINDFDLYDELYCEDGINLSQLLINVIKGLSSGIIDAGNIVKKTDFTEDIRNKMCLKASVKKIFDELIPENCNRLIIFVDEIDRCKPTYAIKLLERIKHYIDDDRILIVLSTNIKELSNTISSMYGANFSSSKYLDKFFDLRLVLPYIDIDKYLESFNLRFIRNKSEYFSKSVLTLISYFPNHEMRDIERYLTILKHFEENINRHRNEWCRYIDIINFVILPYIVYLYVLDYYSYDMVVSGNGFEIFKKFVQENADIYNICKNKLYDTPHEKNPEHVYFDIEKLYNYLFKSRKNIDKIGDYSVEFESIANISEIVSLLGDYASFGVNKEN